MIYYEKIPEYKYKLCSSEDLIISEDMRQFITERIHTAYYSLCPSGYITAWVGYAWNGASGIPDTSSNTVPSLVHDIWYQAIRDSHLPMEAREAGDIWFGDQCHNRGTPRLVANVYTNVLVNFGERYATPRKSEILTAS